MHKTTSRDKNSEHVAGWESSGVAVRVISRQRQAFVSGIGSGPYLASTPDDKAIAPWRVLQDLPLQCLCPHFANQCPRDLL